jgi:hypothetical protein
MPQFDFFIWFSLSLGAILTFQFLYYFILYYILAPFADLQKTLIKLYTLKQSQQNLSNLSLFEQLTKIYLQKIKLNQSQTMTIPENLNFKKDGAVNSNVVKKIQKTPNTISRLKATKNINLTKKDKFLITLKNTLSISRFLLSAAKIEPLLHTKRPAVSSINLPNTSVVKDKTNKGTKKKS